METLKLPPIIAVLVIDDPADAVPLAECLLSNGIRAMELTLRTDCALKALVAVRERVPEMLAGVGTVINPTQVERIKDAGAQFGVVPGTNRRVIEKARDLGLPFGPGVATPSDIEVALEYECRILKFFPAEPSGGLPFLQSMAGPYAHLGLSFIPLGGLSEDNLANWLRSPLVKAVGGSWIAPRELIQNKDWKEIGRRAKNAQMISQNR